MKSNKRQSPPFLILLFLLFGMAAMPLSAQEKKDIWAADNFSGLKMRSIGPAFMSGRIADIAIDPNDESTWYVAVGSGGVWKTTNNGISWKPVFDDQTSYSTGCITIDPNNSSTIWLGTGENVGGRHVGFGDGIYRSNDGGKKWQNMGLTKSEHISKIIVHPDNSNTVWVAVQGPLWTKGGERGFYKTTDGGKSWRKTLGDEEWTGVTDIVVDPRNPNRLYAATWQRHRTVAAYIGGGPKTALYRSEDAGETWTKLEEGLPKSNMGKIGLAISPQNPDVLYAAIELDQREGGVYKSTDRGSNWSKQSDAVSGATGPHYYQELYASPHHEGRLYLMDVRVQVSEDGGKTFNQMPEKHKHSDNHAMAFRTSDPNYLLVGTDGGLYESFDLGQNWRFINNMPITQFYKLAVDDAKPFYNIYGGTQDNNTQGGPSRTDNGNGIQNSDWKVALFGDGHQPATEPGNPNILYAQWQQGNLVRIDVPTGEVTYIRPQPEESEDYERYNWDAPIFVSPHNPKRIYHGSQRLWRSDDRGDSWKAVSPDLTKDQERIELPIMGRKQSWDNPWDLYAMSNFSTITSIAESPLQEGLIYIGTDDGLLQITTNGGESWTKVPVSKLPGVPSTAYVNDIKADLFDANTVYVALDDHKGGDFKPYLFKSTNAGKTWTNIGSTLPDRHLVWRLVQDHVDKDLFFIGTEFGIFFTVDAGARWTKLKGGMPAIPVRDLTIQRRENDLVAATFGRSFYVYDDISAFRQIDEAALKSEAKLYPSRKTLWYIPKPNLSFGDNKGSQGEAHFVADNPPFGAVFTYSLKDGYTTLKAKRQEAEKELNKTNADIPFPGWDKIEMEQQEDSVMIWLVISDVNGKVIRKVSGPTGKGFHRVAWDLKYPSKRVVTLNQKKVSGEGLMAPPGEYFVQLQKEEKGKITNLSEKQSFMVETLYQQTLSNPLAGQRNDFWRSYEDLVMEHSYFVNNLRNSSRTARALGVAFQQAGIQNQDLLKEIETVEDSITKMMNVVFGNVGKNKVGEKNSPNLDDRIDMIYMALSNSTYGPTPTAMRAEQIAKKELKELKAKLEAIDSNLKVLANKVAAAGGPPVEGLR